jgi:hypothetical protein
MRQRTVVVVIIAVMVVGSVVTSAPEATPVAGVTSEQAVAIIVNSSNSVDNFSFDELRKVFLGERSHWPNGRRITLVMMDPAQPERKLILREVYAMTEKDFSSHFIQGVFTGSVLVSPKTLSTTAEVKKFVLNVPGAIRVDGRLPDDKDYKLRLVAKK